MTKGFLYLGAVLALSFAAERWLDRAERARRANDPAIELLVAKDRIAGEPLAAISIETSTGSLLYGRKLGHWRCREAFGAVCDETALRTFLEAFFDARGVERSAGESSGAIYGFAGDERMRVKFRGTKALAAADEDVLFAFEVGRSFDEGPHGRSFVRELGSQRILEIDRDPRRALASEGESIPPLVDAQFLAGTLTGEFRGIREIRIEHQSDGGNENGDGEPMRITRDPAAPMDADAPWVLERGERREAFPGWRVGGYFGLWLRGSFESFESSRSLAEIGLDPPAAKITLVPETGDPIELVVSAVDGGRRAHVLNRTTNVAGAVAAELQPLLAPRAELFTDTTRPNPWELWLRKP